MLLTIPFPGSKRYSYKYLKEIILEHGYTTLYEPFGGSAVLSVNAYKDGLIETAYINDYDRMFDDYDEFLEIKKKLIEDCRRDGLVKRTDISLPDNEAKILRKHISKIDKKWWRLLSFGSCFCFSSVCSRNDKRINLGDFSYFHRGLDRYDHHKEFLSYINELNRDSLDYKEFVEKYKDDFDSKSLIILDPPYMNTPQKGYKNDDYFGKEETIELINIMKDLKVDFVFFNGNEEIYEYLPKNKLVTTDTHKFMKTKTKLVSRKDYMVHIKATDWE